MRPKIPPKPRPEATFEAPPVNDDGEAVGLIGAADELATPGATGAAAGVVAAAGAAGV